MAINLPRTIDVILYGKKDIFIYFISIAVDMLTQHNLTLKNTSKSASAQRIPPEREFRSMKPEPERADTLAGAVISGRYALIERIGAGGTAEVYSAVDRESGGRVAIKIALSDDDGTMNSFMGNEIARLGQVSHPSLIRCLGSGEHKGRRYAVLELLEGSSLDALMQKEGGIKWEMAREVLVKVCDALSEVHAKGLVHRDLKPANVYVTNGREVKLIDFGLAATERTEVEPGTVIGTPSYISPECIRGKACDARCDIYSLGVMAYEMLCGEKPFSATSVVDMLLMHRDEMPLSPGKIAPWLHIPRAIETLIMRAMEKDPQRRIQTAAEMKAGLEALPAWTAPAFPFSAAFAPTVLHLQASL